MKRKTVEEFVSAAVEKFGTKFNYDEVNYQGTDTKVKITCPIHGAFWQTPYKHLVSKHGCSSCGRMSTTKAQTKPFSIFYKKAIKKFGDKFIYNEKTYVNMDTKMGIVCPEHGEFQQSPEHHLKSVHGCPKCAIVHVADVCRKSEEQFIAEINGRFTLLEPYINDSTAIKVICNTCGNSSCMVPSNMLHSSGCKYCANYGFNNNKPAILYYLRIGNNAYKIGITNRTVKQRFNTTELATIKVLNITNYTTGVEALRAEQEILKTYKEYRWDGEDLLRSGNTELFKIDVLGLDND